MGLDMMLYKLNKRKEVSHENIGGENEVAYWRKANAIHGFIYKYCAKKGQEDYDLIVVEKKWLKVLKDICKHILEDLKTCKVGKKRVECGFEEKDGKLVRRYTTIDEYKSDMAKKLLPVTQGFFFGSYSYGDNYKQDLEDTIEQIDNILKTVNFKTNNIVYYASY